MFRTSILGLVVGFLSVFSIGECGSKGIEANLDTPETTELLRMPKEEDLKVEKRNTDELIKYSIRTGAIQNFKDAKKDEATTGVAPQRVYEPTAEERAKYASDQVWYTQSNLSNISQYLFRAATNETELIGKYKEALETESHVAQINELFEENPDWVCPTSYIQGYDAIKKELDWDLNMRDDKEDPKLLAFFVKNNVSVRERKEYLTADIFSTALAAAQRNTKEAWVKLKVFSESTDEADTSKNTMIRMAVPAYEKAFEEYNAAMEVYKKAFEAAKKAAGK